MQGSCNPFSDLAKFLWDHAADYFINISSDLLLVLLVIVIGPLIYQFTKGRRLQSFFGLSGDQTFDIYLSGPSWHGARITPDKIDRTLFGMGVVIPFVEYEAVQKVIDNFKFLVPGSGELPKEFQKMFFAQNDVRTFASSVDRPSPKCGSSSFLTVGSGAFNEASVEFETRTGKDIAFEHAVEPDKHGVPQKRLTSLKTPFGEFIPDCPENAMIAVLARGRLGDITGFYAAGFDEICTCGAVYYLAKNWQTLSREFGESDFAIVLGFSGLRDVSADQPFIKHKGIWLRDRPVT